VVRLNAGHADIQNLWLNLHILRAMAKIAGASTAVVGNPYFMYCLTSQYAQATCSAIRLLTESGEKAKTTNSLVAAIEDIIGHAAAHRWVFWIPENYGAADGTHQAAAGRVRTSMSCAGLRGHPTREQSLGPLGTHSGCLDPHRDRHRPGYRTARHVASSLPAVDDRQWSQDHVYPAV